MNDPTYIVLNTRLLMLTMHSDADTPKKYVPKGQWFNPLRYSISFRPGGPEHLPINEGGKANTALRNTIFKIKRRLGIWKPSTARQKW